MAINAVIPINPPILSAILPAILEFARHKIPKKIQVPTKNAKAVPTISIMNAYFFTISSFFMVILPIFLFYIIYVLSACLFNDPGKLTFSVLNSYIFSVYSVADH